MLRWRPRTNGSKIAVISTEISRLLSNEYLRYRQSQKCDDTVNANVYLGLRFGAEAYRMEFDLTTDSGKRGAYEQPNIQADTLENKQQEQAGKIREGRRANVASLFWSLG
jgi:hypothetical protein